MTRVRAATVGHDASSVLATPGQVELIAVFEHSAYLRAECGEIACLGPSTLGAGPRNVRCASTAPAWSALDLRAGAAGSSDGTSVNAGGLSLEWQHAPVWHPPALPEVDWRIRLPAGLAIIAEIARAEAPGDGLAPLLVRERDAAGRLQDALTRTARPLMDALGDWVGGRAATAKPLEALVGLGPGLTPSGDDALAAAMVALRAFGATRHAEALARTVAGSGARTGEISRAYLASAARGAGAEALHDVLGAIAIGASDGTRRAVRALARAGHTSGWDALVGLAYVGAAWTSRLNS